MCVSTQFVKSGRDVHSVLVNKYTYLKSVTDGEPYKAWVDPDLDLVLIVPLDDSKQGGKQDYQVSHELKSNGQPPNNTQ